MPSWRDIQKTTITSLPRLCEFLAIDVPEHPPKHFPLLVPLRLAKKMERGNPNDPLLLQFLPQDEPHNPDYLLDPVGDTRSAKTPSLLHKYKGRALLVTTGACAMHCRYCFRQHFPYEKLALDKEIELIAKDSSIREIILSGGDPLSLGDETLTKLLCRLDRIPHISIIRFHSRFLIGIPERITQELLSTLDGLRAQVIFILHINHPRELDDDILIACKKLQRLGIPLFNQSVLLKGINDHAHTLEELSWKLISNGITPYYLHQLDKVAGASRFEVDIKKGKELINKLTASLPGYGVPTYVQELPGRCSKTKVK